MLRFVPTVSKNHIAPVLTWLVMSDEDEVFCSPDVNAYRRQGKASIFGRRVNHSSAMAEDFVKAPCPWNASIQSQVSLSGFNLILEENNVAGLVQENIPSE